MMMKMSSLLMNAPLSPIPKMPANHSCSFHGGPPTQRRLASSTTRRTCAVQCSTETLTTRRSGNYSPSLWDFDYIQSLRTTHYTEESHSSRAAELIAQVKMLMRQETEVTRQLELIDDLNRLGISSHFDQEIDQILSSIYSENRFSKSNERDLYSIALEFRLLREHGFQVPQEVFDCFKNEKGDFKSSLGDDPRGVLQMYEASFLLTRGEESLEQAKEFATKILQRIVDEDGDDENLLESVRLALDLPIHWRIERPNERWSIEAYERRPQMNPTILELAKLDFNILQEVHQQELKHICRWWKETGLSEALPFARDRVVESYFWTLGFFKVQLQYGYARIMAAKYTILITIIDDIFDVYATLEELQLFTNALQRWDVEAMGKLPNYMQLCFLALNNYINEIAYNVLKEQGVLIIQHLRNSWIDLFSSYTQEAKWYAAEYTPTLNEYVNNGRISSSATVVLSHSFFLLTNPIHEDVVQSLFQYQGIVHCSSMILRLANDLGTSPHEMKRGDVPKSVQCYMNETGASTEEARQHIKCMIGEYWKEINEEGVGDSQFSKTFITAAVDLARMSQYMYYHGDGHGIQNSHMTDRISALLFQPM